MTITDILNHARQRARTKGIPDALSYLRGALQVAGSEKNALKLRRLKRELEQVKEF